MMQKGNANPLHRTPRSVGKGNLSTIVELWKASKEKLKLERKLKGTTKAITCS